MSNLLLKGGALVNPEFDSIENQDCLIENGIIKRIAPDIAPGDTQVVSVEGKVLAPGFVDLQTHICEHWQDIEPAITTVTQAAVKGGFTTICAMSDTNPPLDNEGMIGLVLSLAAQKGYARVLPAAGATLEQKGEALSEIGTLVAAGAALIYDSDKTITNSLLQRRLMEYSRMFSVPLFLHCEDPLLAGDGVMHEGFTATCLGLPGIPSIAEEIALQRDLCLASYTGASVHITHVSTMGSVQAIRRCKRQGVRVTCSVTPHHLDLIDEDIKEFDTHFKVKPPLRSREDREALIEGLKDGTIDCIASDHRGGTGTEHAVHFGEAPFGFASLETCFQACYERMVLKEKLPLPQLLYKLSRAPWKILNQDRGILKEGAEADLTVLNLKEGETIHPENRLTENYRSPYLGHHFQTRVEHCLVQGNLRYPLETSNALKENQ